MRLSAKIAAIEFDGDEIRVAVIKTGARKSTVLEARARRAVYETPQDRHGALVACAREVCGHLKSRPALYVLCVDSQYSMVRPLTIPFRGARKVAQAVVFELEPYLAVPIEDLVVDHCTVREIEGQTEVLAVGVRKAFLEEQLDVLHEAGIRPEGINLDAAGLMTLWQVACRNGQGLQAILHVREHASTLCIVHDRSLAFFRPLAIPASRLHEDPAAVSREVQNSLRAFLATWRGESTLAELTVTGTRLTPGEAEAFEDGVQPAVQYLDLSRNINGSAVLERASRPREVAGMEGVQTPDDPALHESPNYWEAAVGTAIAAAGNGFSFEFCKGPCAAPGSLHGFVMHAVFSAALLALILVGSGVYCYLDYRNNEAQIERNGQKIWEIFAQTFPDSEVVKDGRLATDVGGIQTLQFMQAAHDKALGAGTGLPVDNLLRPNLLDVLKEISEKLPGDQVLVDEIKIRDARGTGQVLTIQGEAEDVSALNTALDNLKKSRLIKVEDEPTKQTMRDGKTGFTVTATI